MNWTPRSQHVSQLQYNPNTGGLDGREDCGPASCVRALREYGKLDPAGDRLAQLNTMRELIDHAPDEPGQGGTGVTDLERALAHYGIAGAWSSSYAAAEAAPMAIVLVDYPPSPQQYPPSWLGGQSHWILWLPRWQGQFNWFNDPLAYNNHQEDAQYNLTSVQAAFQGAILLPALPVAAPATAVIAEACALKVQASHSCSALARLPVGLTVQDLAAQLVTDDTWRKVGTAGKVGWVPVAKLKAA